MSIAQWIPGAAQPFDNLPSADRLIIAIDCGDADGSLKVMIGGETVAFQCAGTARLAPPLVVLREDAMSLAFEASSGAPADPTFTIRYLGAY
jgi:hypothetical protein